MEAEEAYQSDNITISTLLTIAMFRADGISSFDIIVIGVCDLHTV